MTSFVFEAEHMFSTETDLKMGTEKTMIKMSKMRRIFGRN